MGYGSPKPDAVCSPCPAGEISRGGFHAQCQTCADWSWNNDFRSACGEFTCCGGSLGSAERSDLMRQSIDYSCRPHAAHMQHTCSTHACMTSCAAHAPDRSINHRPTPPAPHNRTTSMHLWHLWAHRPNHRNGAVRAVPVLRAHLPGGLHLSAELQRLRGQHGACGGHVYVR